MCSMLKSTTRYTLNNGCNGSSEQHIEQVEQPQI